MRRSEDCAVPIGHHQVIAIRQTVGTCLCSNVRLRFAREQDGTEQSPTCTEALLAFLQLFQQPEVSRHFSTHGEDDPCELLERGARSGWPVSLR